MTLLGILIFGVGFLVGWVVRNLVETDTSTARSVATWICSRCDFEQSNERMVCERCGHKQRVA